VGLDGAGGVGAGGGDRPVAGALKFGDGGGEGGGGVVGARALADLPGPGGQPVGAAVGSGDGFFQQLKLHSRGRDFARRRALASCRHWKPSRPGGASGLLALQVVSMIQCAGGLSRGKFPARPRGHADARPGSQGAAAHAGWVDGMAVACRYPPAIDLPSARTDRFRPSLGVPPRRPECWPTHLSGARSHWPKPPRTRAPDACPCFPPPPPPSFVSIRVHSWFLKQFLQAIFPARHFSVAGFPTG
jgi:hypothetical protein